MNENIRDRRKNKEYFENYISYQNKRIINFKKAANDLSPEDTDKKNRIFRIIANFQKDLFSAMYSIGASKDELKKIFDEYISNLSQIKTDDYAEYIDALAIGILLDVDFNTVKAIAADDAFKDDILVCALLNYSDCIKNELQNFPEYYQIFFDYLVGEKTITDLSDYMSGRWYETNNEFAWYDSDKSSEDIYTGYWCWIAAACIKLKKEDDLREYLPIEYVPSDLL